MFVRARWFTVGFLSALGLGAFLADRVRRARERLTPRGAARASARGLADALESAARRIAPPAG